VQPVAIGGRSTGRRSRGNNRNRSPWIVTGCRSETVRRGSTVRVRQRALQSPCRSAPSVNRTGEQFRASASTERPPSFRERVPCGVESLLVSGFPGVPGGVHPASTALSIASASSRTSVAESGGFARARGGTDCGDDDRGRRRRLAGSDAALRWGGSSAFPSRAFEVLDDDVGEFALDSGAADSEVEVHTADIGLTRMSRAAPTLPRARVGRHAWRSGSLICDFLRGSGIAI
jgi:hypothetical protein